MKVCTMTNIPDENLQGVMDEYEGDDKALALTLAVYYWSHAVANEKTTPPKDGSIIQTAQVFENYLVSEYH